MKNDILKKIKKENRNIKLTQIIIGLLFIIIWELLSRFKIINSFIFSSPSKIIKTITDLFGIEEDISKLGKLNDAQRQLSARVKSLKDSIDQIGAELDNLPKSDYDNVPYEALVDGKRAWDQEILSFNGAIIVFSITFAVLNLLTKKRVIFLNILHLCKYMLLYRFSFLLNLQIFLLLLI